MLHRHLVGRRRSGRAEAQRLGVHVLPGRGRQWVPRVADDVRVAQLGHAVDGVLFVLHAGVLVGLLLIAAPAVLHAQHRRDGGQRGHGHGHGQHDHEQTVDGRTGHLRLFLHGHVFGPVAESGRPLFRTSRARVSGRALAPEAAATGGHARAAVGAGRRLHRALVHIPAAVLAAEPGSAAAPEVVLEVLARAAVGARLGHTVVHLALAQVANVPGNALAPVSIGLHLASAAVLARVPLAVVGQVAVGSGEPGRALARVTGAVLARQARSSVPARVRLTVVGRLVARRPGKPDRTVAQVPVVVVVVVVTGNGRRRGSVVLVDVHASGAVGARRTRTSRQRGRFASDALPLAGARTAGHATVFLQKKKNNKTVRTLNRQRSDGTNNYGGCRYEWGGKKLIGFNPDTHLARSAIQASQSRGAVQSGSAGQSQVDVALGTRETGRTRTRVEPLARVETRAAVLARRVVGAIVQVLVAEHTAPSLFAQTLPRLLAVAVHAARIDLTLVASGSRPTGVTPAEGWKQP